VDVAVRLAALPDSTMTAIKLGEVRMLVCASPNYLQRAGSPASPRELSHHDCIGLNAEGNGELWPFRSVNDKGAAFDPFACPRVSASIMRERRSMRRCGGRGAGSIRARAYQVAEALSTGHLVQVLKAYEPPLEPAHLVFHPDRGRRGPVRAFIDYAVPILRSEVHRITSIIPLPG